MTNESIVFLVDSVLLTLTLKICIAFNLFSQQFSSLLIFHISKLIYIATYSMSNRKKRLRHDTWKLIIEKCKPKSTYITTNVIDTL